MRTLKHNLALGFTIVEILIVIVVIAILALITVVAYNGMQNRAQLVVAQSDLNSVQKKLALFQVDNSSYPTSIVDCPTPASTNICANSSGGNSFTYQAITASSIVLSPAYEVRVSNARQFIYTSPLEKTSVNEFLQYTDLAPIIDQYGLVKYQIDFDIKSANTASASSVSLYMQNGSGAKYSFGASIPVTTSYVRQTAILTPTLSNASLTQSILAFYGTYGTGNIATVKNMRIQLAP